MIDVGSRCKWPTRVHDETRRPDLRIQLRLADGGIVSLSKRGHFAEFCSSFSDGSCDEIRSVPSSPGGQIARIIGIYVDGSPLILQRLFVHIHNRNSGSNRSSSYEEF